MALGRVKTWVKETLTFQDLNIEFNNILNNATTLISPATAAWDMDGNSLILDSDGDTALILNTGNQIGFQLGGTVGYIMTDTELDLTGKLLTLDDDGDSSFAAASDDIAKLTLQGFEAFIFDGDVSSPLNGITFASAGTGAAASITAQGETTASLAINPGVSGTVDIDFNGGELVLDADGDSSITVDTDDVLHMRLQAFDAFIFDGDVASPVNGISFISSATGVAPQITDHGENDTGLTILPSGTGALVLQGLTNSSWTPELQFGAANTGMTYDTQTGTYIRIDNLVFVDIYIKLTAKGSSTGTATVSLPLTSANTDQGLGSFTLNSAGSFASLTSSISLAILPNTVTVFLGQWSSSATGNLTQANFLDTAEFYISGWYEVA